MLTLKDLTSRSDLKVDRLTISPSRRLVCGSGGDAYLEPLIMQVFLLLIDARGSVVTRAELFERCWGGGAVGDDSLNRAVAQVRRTLAQVAPEQFAIETIPRTGYRLTTVPKKDQPDASETAEETHRPDPSIGLSRRSAIIAGAAVAAAVGVGSWALFAEREGSDAEPLIARGDQILRYDVPGTRPQAIALLKQAISLEEDNKRAWGLLAYALALVTEDGPQTTSPKTIAEAEEAIQAALALDGREANALLARLMLENSYREWIGTDRRLRTLLGIDPRNTFALARLVWMTQAAGLNHESWRWNERAIAIDPLAPNHQFRRALKHWIAGRIVEADMGADRVLQLWPTHPWVWNARFIIYAFTDRPLAALDMLDDVASRPTNLTPEAVATWRLSLIALKERSAAVIRAAREANLKAARSGPGLAAYGVMILAALSEIDAAFEIANGFLLARGSVITRKNGDGAQFVNTATWRVTPWLFTPPVAKMRVDPRFGPLCDGMGLTAYWRSRGVQPDYLSGRA